jgi:hypothetical protein
LKLSFTLKGEISHGMSRSKNNGKRAENFENMIFEK